MVSILKSDITWFPESSDGKKFTVRANNTFKVKSNDFENYFTGINFDFKKNNKLCFSLVNKFKGKLTIKNNEMIESNYLDKTSKMITLVNDTNEDILISDKEPLFVYSLCEKNQPLKQDEEDIEPNRGEKVVDLINNIKETSVVDVEPTTVVNIVDEVVDVEPTPAVEVVDVEPTPAVEVVGEVVDVESTPAVEVVGEVVDVEPTPAVEVVEVEPTPVVNTADSVVDVVEDTPKKRKYIKRTKQ